LKPKVIITAYAHSSLAQGLEQRGYVVELHEKISHNELLDVIDQYEGMIVSTRINIDKTLLDKANSLKWIGRLGSGMEIIDVAHAKAKNIVCMSSPEGNCSSVGEHCLGLLLSLMHKINSSAIEVTAGKWIREANRGMELGGKTVGIIGLGHTGTSFAKLLSGFGVRVLAHDKYKTGFGAGHVVESTLEALLKHADVISFHLPLNEETHHYANDFFFSRLEKMPYFLNVSRGGVVDTAALISALDQRKIAAAGLDVLENEDLATYSTEEKARLQDLVMRTNVIVTPHIAGSSVEALVKMADHLLRKLDLLSAG